MTNILPDGYILQGTVVKRYLKRRVGGVSKQHGPYYLWTRKIENKTSTKALTMVQSQIVQETINRSKSWD